MSLVRLIHSINSLGCFALGLLLNVFLGYVIWTKTMKEMNNYSRILLQTCYSDVFLLTAALLTQPIYVVDDNVSKIVLNGPFLNPQLGCVAYVVWLFSIFFSIVGMSVQFVYRYITLCHSRKITTIIYLNMLAIPAVLLAILSTIQYISLSPTPAVSFVQNFKLLEILNGDETGGRLNISFEQNPNVSPYWNLMLSYCSNIIILSCYLIIAFCIYKIMRFMRKHLKNSEQSKIREANNQLTITLFVQAILPVIGVLVILCLFLFKLKSGFGELSTYIVMLETVPLNWLPVLNPVVALVTVKTYRQSLFVCCSKRHKIAHSLVVSIKTNSVI